MGNFVKENHSDGYSVFKAGNGDNIINIVYARILDLAITDITMPEAQRTGPEQRAEHDQRTGQTPGVRLKTRTTIETRIEGLVTFDGGALNKPPDINELKLRITNLLIEREKFMPQYGSTAGTCYQETLPCPMDEIFMTKIDRIINDNIKSLEFDVGMLQREMGMSRVQLYRKVKALSGVSPSVMINNHRMQRAAKLIHGKAGNLAEISLSVGFTNPSYFSKRFREFYGRSPRTFSKQPTREYSEL
jgi:AraC-like DNA-binding protein